MQYASNGGMTQRHHVLLVAAADGSEGLPPTIRRCFSHEVSMGPLTEEQRVTMLSQSLQSVSKLLPDVCLLISFISLFVQTEDLFKPLMSMI